MKLLFLLFIATAASFVSFAQKPVHYVNIPNGLKQGEIIYDLHVSRTDSSFSILSLEMPNRISDAAFFFMVDKNYQIVDSNYLKGKKVITPQIVQDSLTAKGWDFFRTNQFYCVFKRGASTYIHEAEGVYIYKNYEGDYQSVNNSTIRKNR